MRFLAPLFLVLVCINSAFGEETVREIRWTQSTALSGELAEYTEVPGENLLRVSSPQGQALESLVLVMEDPKVTQGTYALVGRVFYENISEPGYLMMNSYFSGSRSYFTKTLASKGPLSKLEGSSDWRDIVIPFYSGKNKTTNELDLPRKIELFVVLPRGGTLFLRTLKLKQYLPGENPLALSVPGAWWTDAQGGYIGGIVGSIIGLLGGILGVLGGMGRARAFVLGLARALFCLGIAALVLGVAALIDAQPSGVYYPLLLMGGILIIVIGLNFRGLERRYSEREMRQMEALDAARS